MADIPAGLYGRDQTRAELHAALCEHYGLTREQTQDVTDHMDRLDHHDGGGSTALHKALQDLWDKYPSPNCGRTASAPTAPVGGLTSAASGAATCGRTNSGGRSNETDEEGNESGAVAMAGGV